MTDQRRAFACIQVDLLTADRPAFDHALAALDAVAADPIIRCSCACTLASLAALAAGGETTRAGLLAICRLARRQCAEHVDDSPAAELAAEQ
jgi:hypothetical protein